jgi:hypothetical protein
VDIITPDTQELMIMPGFALITKIIKKIGLDIEKNILYLHYELHYYKIN